MPLVNFQLAQEASAEDDADLRHLLQINPLPGDIHLSYEREPSFWAAAGLEGPLQQTMIVRDKTGRAVGMGSRSVRSLFVNGEAQPVGYLSQMRVDPTYPWGIALPKALAQGWRYIRQLHQDGLTPYYLVSLVTGDNVAWRMMTLGLPDWPTLHTVGGMLTFGLHLRRGKAVPRLDRTMKLRRAGEADREAIVDCLTRNGRRRRFAPVWDNGSLGAATVTPGLTLSDFWLVEKGSQVVGTLARWNQRAFKQSVVHGYDEPWLRSRTYINVLAWFGFAPYLPALGEEVRHSFASHFAVDNDDPQVAAALLAAVFNGAVAAGDSYLMLGMDSENSLASLVRRYRRVVYATQLFLAAWGDEVELARTIDKRQMGAGDRAAVRVLMKRRSGERLVEWLLAVTLALVNFGERWRHSPMGYANPRVAGMVGPIGYHAHSYRAAMPAILRWLQKPGDLFPTVVQVQTINRCNASCRMCPYPSTWALTPREVMEDALFSKIAAECAAAPELHDFVPMAQNEPLLDPKLVQRIGEFKRQAQPHQMVELVTNGSALSVARFDELSAAGVDLLTISVNANSEATYQKVMTGLKWSRLMELLETLKKKGSAQVNVYLRYVAQRENRHELRPFVQRWRRHFNLMLYDVNNRAGAVQDYANIATIKNELTRRFRRWIGPRLFKVCPHAFSIMAIMQNGDVLLCGNDWNEREVVGNVRTETLRQVYNNPRMKEVRELMRQGRYDEIAACRNCSFRHEWL